MSEHPRIQVHKLGGASLAEPELIKRNAQEIAEIVKDGRTRVIVVVSAMGKTTNAILAEAKAINPTARLGDPALDLAVASGEIRSTGLACLALQTLGISDSTALAPNQLPMTLGFGNGSSTSLIQQIDARSLMQLLEKNRVVAVPGFLGPNEQKGVATLGRGGSDLSAVAIAGELQTYTRKETPVIFGKKEPAVLATPPGIVERPLRIPYMSHDECRRLVIASEEPPFIAPRAAEVAQALGVTMIFREAACFIPAGLERAFPGTVIAARQHGGVEEASGLQAIGVRSFTVFDVDNGTDRAVIRALRERGITYQEKKESSQGGYKILMLQLPADEDAARDRGLDGLGLKNKRDVGVLRLFHPDILNGQGHITDRVHTALDTTQVPHSIVTEENSIVTEVSNQHREACARAIAEEFHLFETA